VNSLEVFEYMTLAVYATVATLSGTALRSCYLSSLRAELVELAFRVLFSDDISLLVVCLKSGGFEFRNANRESYAPSRNYKRFRVLSYETARQR
jgi:hypothetical protein